MARPKCYETQALKQKAYRERKKKLVGGEKSLSESVGIKTLAKSEIESKFESSRTSSIRDSGHPSVQDLRGLIKQEEEKPATEPPVRSEVVGGIYRNDFGGVISKTAWEKLQEKKRLAKEGGYILDEYSQ